MATYVYQLLFRNPLEQPGPLMDTRASDKRLIFTDNSDRTHPLPLFMPVYQPREPAFRLALKSGRGNVDGLIINAFFLYKQRELRQKLTTEMTLSEFVGFDGLISTDSGAFQGFTRQLFLKNRDIVRFQDRIGSNIIAPLDIVTPPGDSRTQAQSKLDVTNRRIREALATAQRGVVAGVQQGGRFLDLRQRSTEALLNMAVRYVAIGSLVPFFNKNHNLAFAGSVIRSTREMVGPSLPIHVYGAGDPVELPFFVQLGATVFDSASYGHYAAGGFYMTPYGALREPGPIIAGEYACRCPHCTAPEGIAAVFADKDRLTMHNLWTICDTVSALRDRLRTGQTLDRYLQHVLDVHTTWFPNSQLGRSWDSLVQ